MSSSTASISVERPWALRDLLTDLMHWSVAKGFNFHQELQSATAHYAVEGLGESEEKHFPVGGHPSKSDLVHLVEEVASDSSSDVAKAHIALSNALEDPELGNDEVRDAAVEMCDALNALQARAKKATEAEYAVMVSTSMINRKTIKHSTDWSEIRREIANATGVKVEQVPMNLVDRLYNHEDIFFDIRMEMHDDPCWFRAYIALLESGMLVHLSEDNDAGEVVRPTTDGALVTQTQLMEHRMAAHAVRADIVTCIAEAIEGTEEYVRQDLHHAVTSIMQSKDVLLTLSDVLPHCEWFECYMNLYKRDLLTRVR